MYSRLVTERPEKIIQNGKAIFGSFSDVTPKLDIKGMRAPYAGIPLPSVISNLRIKSRINYIFNLDQYIGIVHFFDFKAFALAEVCFWNQKTNKKYVYHNTILPRRRTVPLTTTKGLCASYAGRRFIKIAWNTNQNHYTIDFKVHGDKIRPSVNALIHSNTKDDFHSNMMFVTPAPTKARCSATWLSTMKLNGQINITNENSYEAEGLGLMDLNRSYYKMQNNFEIAYGIGKLHDKNLSLHLQTSNIEAADSNKYNSNILIVDNETTMLPPVDITHPFGTSKNWIIQDTESMVDLTFTPSSVNTRNFNIIAMKNIYTTIYGHYDGVLLDKDGNKIILKNFPGIIYKSKIRL